MFEKGKVADEKILEDKVKLKREIAAVEQKQSTLEFTNVALVRVCFLRRF